MAKKKQQNNRNNQKQKKQEDKISVLDHLDQNVFSKLKEKQKELKSAELRKQEEEEQRKREERKFREKNKSFEELLSESDLDWKKFK